MKLNPAFLILVLILAACGTPPIPDESLLTPPAISVQITRGYCPSVEIESGMQISWTNQDRVDRLLIIERVDVQGVVMDSGGTDLLQPGGSFSIALNEPGEYTYYCSLDHTEFGTILVFDPASASATLAIPTPQCVETLVPPAIVEIQPSPATAGQEMTVIGVGGIVQDSCGGVNESARVFPLYLDHEFTNDFQCYVNHCEAKIQLPETMAEGTHCLSVQAENCDFEFKVLAR